METLNLNQEIEMIAKQLGEFIKSNSQSKSFKGDFAKDEGILQHILLEVGGYYDFITETHLPKVEIKITPSKK